MILSFKSKFTKNSGTTHFFFQYFRGFVTDKGVSQILRKGGGSERVTLTPIFLLSPFHNLHGQISK